jgi:raffinose/stachyose/melibiose transport system permease protein
MSSFAISRMIFGTKRMRGNLYLFFLLGLAVPVYTLIFPLYRINISLGFLNTKWAVIFPYVATAISFNTLVFVGFLNGFPSELEEASIIDGCNIFQLCTRIVVPISKAVFATVTVFNVIYIWNEYPFAITFLSDRAQYTISLSASLFKGLYSIDYSGIVAATVMIIIPQLLFYASLQKFIIEGMTEGAIKG